MGTGQPRIGGANSHADHDEQERGGDGCGSKPLEAGQGSSGVGRCPDSSPQPLLSRSPARLPPMRSPDARRTRPGALAYLCVALAAAACNGSARLAPTSTAALSPAASSSAACPAIPSPGDNVEGWGQPPTTPSVVPILITSPVVCGPNRVLFSFVDQSNTPVAAPDRSASLAIYELGRDPAKRVATADGEFIWAIEDERGVYV